MSFSMITPDDNNSFRKDTFMGSEKIVVYSGALEII